jgi:hypothetical protein
MPHVPFTKVISEISKGKWGNEHASLDDAKKDMIGRPEKMTAYALVELLKRLDAICNSVGSPDTDTNDQELSIPDNAKKFPDKQSGDLLFSGDCDDGFCVSIIVAKDENDICMIVSKDEFNLKYPPPTRIACEWMFSTLEDAAKSAVESNIQYYEPRLKFTRKVEKALADGDDLGQLKNGYYATCEE